MASQDDPTELARLGWARGNSVALAAARSSVASVAVRRASVRAALRLLAQAILEQPDEYARLLACLQQTDAAHQPAPQESALYFPKP